MQKVNYERGMKLVLSQVDDFNCIFEFHSQPRQLLILEHEGGFYGRLPIQVRPATNEEIAVGHRIDNDMGDDSHIENHVSPNCKKFDERVNSNETN